MVPGSNSYAERVFQRNDSLAMVFNARDVLTSLA